jgi:hypothetical protein
MTANQRTYRFTVTSHEGQPLFTVLITRDRREPATSAEVSPAAATTSTPPNGSVNRNDGDPPMTEPQKRYLFRLLAQRGIDGKNAEAHLKKTFQVATLHDVSKTTASQLIEQMIATQKEAGHAHA